MPAPDILATLAPIANAASLMIKAIVEATGGAVTAHDLVFGEPRRPKEAA